ncbi:MAG TPA: helix-turn-helix transcriptional regulator [Candidatus Aphodoplasma excrementigallinarum]|uniref:Helix-turn-helix transcriptional regulator n=1 Tax=Candidatus Aphodoplasma excrementigallinarum TaxID=2840673 RepID=A0A9D1NG61_9FIRM|nr:helix-turn-helix transcriptional regulator [Candidatus Aphodoplasma excrementigallinarum]
MSEDEVLAKKLRAYRYKRGLSQKELARQVGVSQETIGKIERQKIKPSLDTIVEIAFYFGIMPSDLLDTQEGT